MAVTNSPPLMLSCLAWDSRPAAVMRRVAQHLHPHPQKPPAAACPRFFLAQQLVGEFCSRIKDLRFLIKSSIVVVSVSPSLHEPRGITRFPQHFPGLEMQCRSNRGCSQHLGTFHRGAGR
ncbi:hypothetical protein BDA96_05G075900 [Sorghum bicolor]|uniref:Uncharacterized protein n=1 Tax=Sorghum bicolor TaxID=4558 RepID=A0A921QXZ5_SORBI|nr:hypothetical protein BDA96_05G075900 [Sorghum bicolor]